MTIKIDITLDNETTDKILAKSHIISDYVEASGGIHQWCDDFDKRHPPEKSWNSARHWLISHKWLDLFDLIEQEYYEQAIEA